MWVPVWGDAAPLQEGIGPMSLGLHEARARRRRKARWNTVKWLLILSLIGGSSVYAYTSGSQFAEREVAELQLTVDRLTEEVSSLREERSQLQGRVTAIEAKLSEAEERHAANVLEGPLADLVRLTREQLDAGVEPDRLAFLVRSAAKEPSCDRQSTEKRFFVKTPTASGGKSYVTFADGTLTVSAKGSTATDSRGNPEAWFAPDKPVTLSFKDLGGESSEISGLLPLEHSLVLGQRELRFNVVEGRRGYIRVAARSCDLRGG